MKKILAAAFLAFMLILPSFAQDAETKRPIWDHGNNVSNLNYENIIIYKVFEQKESYVVLYAKGGVGIGQAIIPKKWATEVPRKLEFRGRPGNLNSYMTIVTKEGSFYKVLLTLPKSRNDAIWGVITGSVDSSKANADTLEIER